MIVLVEKTHSIMIIEVSCRNSLCNYMIVLVMYYYMIVLVMNNYMIVLVMNNDVIV